MGKKLTAQDLVTAASEHNLETAALIAVFEVESGGSGYLPDGRVKILFERHILYRRLVARDMNPRPLAAALPGLCGSTWNPRQYPYGSQASQWDRVQRVIEWGSQHDPEHWESYKKAALEACSYGLFQIMGYHYDVCGFPDVYAFKHAMEESEQRQLAAMLSFIASNGLLRKLQKKDWRGFVRGYNGNGAVETYTTKLLTAYQRARGQ